MPPSKSSVSRAKLIRGAIYVAAAWLSFSFVGYSLALKGLRQSAETNLYQQGLSAQGKIDWTRPRWMHGGDLHFGVENSEHRFVVPRELIAQGLPPAVMAHVSSGVQADVKASPEGIVISLIVTPQGGQPWTIAGWDYSMREYRAVLVRRAKGWILYLCLGLVLMPLTIVVMRKVRTLGDLPKLFKKLQGARQK